MEAEGLLQYAQDLTIRLYSEPQINWSTSSTSVSCEGFQHSQDKIIFSTNYMKFLKLTYYTLVRNITYSEHCDLQIFRYDERLKIFRPHTTWQPITVVAQSEAWTIFANSNTEIVGSSPTRDLDVLSHAGYQMPLLSDVMASAHSCIPSISPRPCRCTLWLVNYHLTFLPLMPVLEELSSLVWAVWKSARLGLDACWPAGNQFPNSVSTWGS
jgi:hypothetical protein